MICPKCNANLQDGLAGCPFCGEVLPTYQQPEQPTYQQPEQPAYQQPTYQQPTYQPPAYQPPVYQQPTYQQPTYQQPVYRTESNVTKKQYLAEHATEDVRKKATLIPIVMLLALAMVVGGILGSLSMSILDIPMISAVLSAAGEDADAMMAELQSGVEELEYDLERSADAMSPDELADAERMLDSFRKLAQKPSVFHFNEMIGIIGELNVTRDMGIDAEVMMAAEQVMDAIVGLLIGFFVLPALFILLGGLLKNTPLTVIGMILVVLPQLLLCPGIWLLLTLAAMILQTVLCVQLGGAYKRFRNGVPA